MKQTLLAVVIFSTCITAGFSQKDSVLYLNGKVDYGSIEGLAKTPSDSVLVLTENGQKNEISTYRIFSFTQSNSTQILYRPDEFKGDFLSIKETKAVTYGSYDARQTFKPHVAFWTGFGLGLGASIFDTYLGKNSVKDTLNYDLEPGFFKSKPSLFPFLVPPVVTVAWAIPSFKLKDKKILHKEYFKNENFYRGYQRIAKQKRMLSSLFGSVLGVGVGMSLYYIAQ